MVIGIPALILIGIVSAGGISTYKDQETSQSCVCNIINNTTVTPVENSESKTTEIIRLIIAILASISFILTLLKSFLSYDSEAGEHKTAADNYGELFRELDQLLLVPGPVRGDPIETLRSIRNKYDDIIRNSPTLPKKYDVELSFEVVSRERLRSNTFTENIIAPKPEQIPNSKKSLNTSTKDIKKLLNNKKSKKNKLKKVIVVNDISSSDTL